MASRLHNGQSINQTSSKLGLALIFRAVLLSLFAYILAGLNKNALPDYYSYLTMYGYGGEFSSRYAGFATIAALLSRIGLNYEHFRLLMLVLGTILSAIFLRMGRATTLTSGARSGGIQQSNTLMLLFVSVFILEFFLIRLRAGLSIFFVTIAFLTWKNSTRSFSRRVINLVLKTTSIFLSAAIHIETFAIIFVFMLTPILWARYANLRPQWKAKVFFLMSCAIWVVIFWFVTNNTVQFRGENLRSALNVVRFVAIAPIPILLWPVVWRQLRRIGNKKWRNDYFPYFFVLNYMASALVLTLVYLLGQVGGSGEAIVRIMTLSSLGAIVSLAEGGINLHNGIAIYIVTVNSLFFINTVFL